MPGICWARAFRLRTRLAGDGACFGVGSASYPGVLWRHL